MDESVELTCGSSKMWSGLLFFSIAFANLMVSSFTYTRVLDVHVDKVYCPLAYTNNNVVTEDMIQKKAAEDGWPVRHPDSECRCASFVSDTFVTSGTPEIVAAWIAPIDLCELYGVSNDEWEGCAGAPDDHVKVCLSPDKLNTLLEKGACKKTGTGVPLLGYDGQPFCNLLSIDLGR